MSHWLEDAEKKISNRQNHKVEIRERIDHKKSDVDSNRLEIEDDFLTVIEKLNSLMERINNLPRHDRIPFGQIFGKSKLNKLDNQLHKFHSSRRVIIKEFSGILKPFKSQHYKNTRSFFISIDRQKYHVLLEYKEIKAKRVRINDQIKSLWEKINFLKAMQKKEEYDVKESIQHIHINEFNDTFIMKHMDWLAFKDKGETFFIEQPA